MATGISQTLADALLNHVRGTNYSPPSTIYVQLHTGDPGANGTAAALSGRQAATFAAAVAGSMALSNTPEATLAGTATVSHVSFWSAASGGTFLWSAPATASKSGGAGDIIRVSASSLSIGPLAA